jgi:hypothetical protein
MTRRGQIVVPFLALALGVACKKAPPPPSNGPALLPAASSTAAKSTAPSPAQAGIPRVELNWADPPEWKRSERVSPMRKATYVIPHAASEKEDGELGVFYFGPGQGGGIDANMDRWVKQFPDAKLDEVKRADRTVNGLVAHTVEIDSASFNANMMGRGEAKLKPDYALLGAIVEAPSGAYFFKLTGPKATVAAAKPAFEKLLDSVRSSS